MKKRMFKRVVSWLIVLCMVLAYVPAANASSGLSWKKTDLEITADFGRPVEQAEAETEAETAMVRVSIVLEGASTVEAGYATMGIGSNPEAMAYRAELKAVQKRMEKTISAAALDGKALDVVWNMTLVGNMISAWVPRSAMERIAAIPGVKAVVEETQYEPCVAETVEGVAPTAYASAGMIGSNALWSSGYTGAGSRIAIIDTGTDTDHQSFDNGAYLHALQQNAARKGMSLTSYMESLDLMTAADIDAALPEMNLRSIDADVTGAELYRNEKLAFGYNYVDGNLTIHHDADYQGEHGSHVAGIATANRYIPKGTGYAEAATAVMMQGVAPDAQLITMKVFGEKSPYDSDYMVAIEDAILLNCDVVNLSLGTAVPGAPYTDVFSDLLEMMEKSDTVVVISAGNAGNWADESALGSLYADDVSFNTVGSPGSYGSAFTVASVENEGSVGHYFEANGVKAFYAETTGYGNIPMTTMDHSAAGTGTVYDYVYLDGLGYAEEYDGIDVAGKVVLLSRGTLSFAEKANIALSKGAAAVAIYNNEDGVNNMDLTGLMYPSPVVSITMKEGQAIRAASQDQGTHLTGKLTVYRSQGVSLGGDSDYRDMSDFSSWGVPGALQLKPEITAPGGKIYSVWGSNQATGGGSDKYEYMSGTSMAAPQITGMTALLAQVFREQGTAEQAGVSPRQLAQSLLMSTAQPMLESGENYYSLLNQGAGLAQVDLAAQADSYIMVSGQPDGKVKAELGHDPQRTGVYTFSFTLNNLTDAQRVYALSVDVFRQAVANGMLDTATTGLDARITFTGDAVSASGDYACDLNGDGVTNALDADYLLEYVLGNETRLHAEGDLSGDGKLTSYDAHLLLASLGGSVVTLPSGGETTVTVEIRLTEDAKAQLDRENPNGAYVQAFVFAEAVADDEGSIGTAHSIPVLAFYGDWSDASMFDRGKLMEVVYGTTGKIPYLNEAIGPYGNSLSISYGGGKEYYYGGNPILDDETYLPERDSFSSTNGSRLGTHSFSLIRGAGDGRLRIVNAETGEVYMEKYLGEMYPAYYNPNSGQWENTIQYATLNWKGVDAAGQALAHGTKVDIELTAVPYYFRQADGSYSFENLGEGSTLRHSITIDNVAPEAGDILLLDDNTLQVTAEDDRYLAAVALLNASGTSFLAVQSPNQTKEGGEITMELDLSAVYGNQFLVAVYDYANNSSVYEVTLDREGPVRPYFTFMNLSDQTYAGLNIDEPNENFIEYTDLAPVGLPVSPRVMEYVEGYVFLITDDNHLCVASDEDLTYTRMICQIDPYREWLISGFNDLAYNPADGKLYGQFYSEHNYEAAPFLCTIDLLDGTIDVLAELPVDVNTMACDGEGNFYSAAFNSPSLYTYTVESVTAEEPAMTYVGEMGYYGTNMVSSMAWDHNTDKLYWLFPNTMLEIDPETAEATCYGYFLCQSTGLYIRPEEPSETSPFDPTDEVSRIELSHTDTKVMKGGNLQLEATVWPWNVSDSAVIWSSSDETVATVDETGTVTGVGLGSCTITATSKLDGSVSAACTLNVYELEKKLNAYIWDKDGDAWISEFTTSKIPEYTPLTDTPAGLELAAATMDLEGNIYAATLDVNTLYSSLYSVDPETYATTRIGGGEAGFVDLAPAPGQRPNSLMAIYGGNVMQVNARTGQYYNNYYMFQYNLVGLAYIGTQPYTDWDYNTQVDWYFIIDRLGYVYLLGFLEQDGSFYYLEHDQLAPGGIFAEIDFEMDTPYFGSAYFDGEFLYYSAYKQTRDTATLIALDVQSRASYPLGTFAEGVWPVAGLMDLENGVENHIDFIYGGEAVQTNSMKPVAVDTAEVMGLGKAEGTLHSAVVPGEKTGTDEITVEITMPAMGTNGMLKVEYDHEILELTRVEGLTTAFAWRDGAKLDLAFAEAMMIDRDAPVAYLTFAPLAEGKTQLVITVEEISDEPVGKQEFVDVTVGHDCPSEQFVDVKESDWWHEATDYVVSRGYMNGMDATHFGPAATMNRAQFVTVLYRMEGQPAVVNTGIFTDVPDGKFYSEAAYWALQNGITTGTGDGTTFSPDGQLTRTELVTFMYRYAKYKGYDTTVSGDLSAYTDADRVLAFAVEPWTWAVANGIITGMTADTLAPRNLTNRAQAAVIFMRFDSKFA